MSEKVFKPVADVFALIHAGGEPYSWTQDASIAAEWLRDNPKYSVKEFVSLERFQAAIADDLSALQQKLDAVLVENALMIQDYRDTPALRRMGLPLTPETDATLNAVRAEGLKMAIDHMNLQTSEDCADVTVLPVVEMYNQLRFDATKGGSDDKR